MKYFLINTGTLGKRAENLKRQTNLLCCVHSPYHYRRCHSIPFSPLMSFTVNWSSGVSRICIVSRVRQKNTEPKTGTKWITWVYSEQLERTSKAVPISTGDVFLGVIMSRHNSASSLQSHHNNSNPTRRKEREKLLLFTKKLHTNTFKNLSVSNRKASQHANTWQWHHLTRSLCVLVTDRLMGNYSAHH